MTWLDEKKNQYDADMLDWTNQKQLEYENWTDMQEQDFENWRIQEEQNFNTWFATVQEVLDGDTAGQLLNLIAEHKADDMPHLTSDGGYKWNARINQDGSITFIFEEVI